MKVRSASVAVVLALVLAPVPALAHAPSTTPTKVSAPRAVVTTNGSWTRYHHDDAHTGYDSAAPALTSVQPGWVSPVLDGEVFAEPLVFNGIVYAATLNDTVYALNQADGTILWSKNVGAPQTSGWSCSGLVAGILSTPVIDTVANRIYVAAELAAVGSTLPTYHLFGLDLGNLGNKVLDVSIAPTNFDWQVQQQRGALAQANGYIYVPFGGRAGDCFDLAGDPYYSWVAGVPTAGGMTNIFQNPATAAGSWAAGGVVVDDSSHNVFFATGNAIPCSGAVRSDSVIRTNPTLGSPTFFQPKDWAANWCGPDSDLGSASPVLISPNLLFQAGKHGGGFLVNPTNLGGTDGQLYPPGGTSYAQADVCAGSHSDATFGSFAYAAPYVYLECETPNNGLGLVALNVNTSAPSFTPCGTSCPAPDWHVGGTTQFGPPIVAAGAVWAASNSGLTAYNATTGALIYQSASFGVNRFVTPSEAGGQVFVPSRNVIRSFNFGGLGQVTVTPANLDFSGQSPMTTSSAQTVTLHNNQLVTVSVTTAALTGANAANYVKGTDTCTGMTVAAGGTCTVQVSFMPGTFGGFPANLTFTDNGPGSPRTVALNGMGALDNQGHFYTLDGYGGLHPDGSAPSLGISAYWLGWNIARSVALFPDGQGGYVMDGWGGLHPVGNAPSAAGAYWPGWDIARQVVLAPWSSHTNPAGWTLDGWGGVHPFGGAPGVTGNATWAGWDIAHALVILPDSTPGSVAGYTLDGFGGVHAFGGAMPINNEASWPGWDIARGITLSPNASKTNPAGWTLDGFGGVHPFGTGQAIPNFAYWGWDIARGIVSWTGSGGGGWVLEGFGGIHPFGNAPSVAPFAYWPGWDIATSAAGSGSSTGSRRRT
jgi:putative pyrroloquinoline-quinone binding quinoprotein